MIKPLDGTQSWMVYLQIFGGLRMRILTNHVLIKAALVILTLVASDASSQFSDAPVVLPSVPHSSGTNLVRMTTN